MPATADDHVFVQGLHDVKAIEDRFGLPDGFVDSLRTEDDWSLVIKAHALLESVCSNLLTLYFGKPELADIFTSLEMSNLRTGKIAFVEAIGLLSGDECAFIKRLSKLRNKLVHDASNAKFDLCVYLSSLPRKKQVSLAAELNLKLAAVEVDDLKNEGIEAVLRYPQVAIWGSLLHCLSRVYFESAAAVEKHKLLGGYLDEVRSKGPKILDPRTASIDLMSLPKKRCPADDPLPDPRAGDADK